MLTTFKIKPINTQWWKDASHKLFRPGDKLVTLREDIYAKYPQLSNDHLHHLIVKVACLIYYEFSRAKSDEDLLESLTHLSQIIKDEKIFTDPGIKWNNLYGLSHLNAGAKDTLERILWNEAIGLQAQRLAPPPNPLDYAEAARMAIRWVATEHLRDFFNFLVTKPQPTETEQKMIKEIPIVLQGLNSVPATAPSTSSQSSLNNQPTTTEEFQHQPKKPKLTGSGQTLVKSDANQPQLPHRRTRHRHIYQMTS